MLIEHKITDTKTRSYRLLLVLLIACLTLLLLGRTLMQPLGLTLAAHWQPQQSANEHNRISQAQAQHYQTRLSSLKMHNAMRFVNAPEHPKNLAVNAQTPPSLIFNQQSELYLMASPFGASQDDLKIEEKVAQWEARFQSKMNRP